MVVTKILNHFSFHRSSMVGTHLPDDGSMHLPNNASSSTNSNVRIMALSMARGYDRDTILTRKFCEDRRGFFDHLRPSVFAKNAFRIAFTQSTTVITNYFNDQLKNEIDRGEKVLNGTMTRDQADREEEKWRQDEWNLRIASIPNRIAISFAKYHAIVIVMRCYEHIASKYWSDETLDKYTMDTFECAKRTAKSNEDYSVHQIILAYGYYLYIQNKRRRIRQGKQSTDEGQEESLVLSFLRKSSLLAYSRAISLGFSSLGGALGTMCWPGWGTVVGINLGDSFSLTLTDDIQYPTIK